MEKRKVHVQITNPDGSIIFDHPNFEVPEFWSDRAATITANKYAAAGEHSAFQIIDRVVTQITKWGKEQGYFKGGNGHNDIPLPERFAADLTDILLNQRASFNSPVWFNLGVKENHQQVSACFVSGVEDNMEDILEHTKREGLIFKNGSGIGINISKLRAKGELLSNKGSASGPISFMRGYDAFAGVIKSGGKSRRSARLVCLNTDHPDIMEFIECKAHEENKAKILIANGVEPEEAYSTVDFQNTNHSIRVSDEFMDRALAKADWELKPRKSGENIKIPARDILRRAAEIAWETGDPGIQFDDRMNQANPVPSLGRINSTNPCSEFSAVDNSSCNLASINLVKYLKKDGEFDWDLFETDINIMVTAMDILVDPAYYPTKEIGEVTRATRSLGLGYSNLGALLMLKGLPYDSDDARELAAEITREMTYMAYRQSIKLAERLEPFSAYAENQEAVQKVAYNVTYDADIVEEIRSKGIRNSQLTLLAPTGCLTGNSLVLSSKGLLPIETLGKPEGKRWQAINININQENSKALANKFYLNGLDSVINIRTKRGHEISSTYKHKFRVIDKQGNYAWREASKLNIGDLIATRIGGHRELLADKEYQDLEDYPITHPLSIKLKLPQKLNEQFAEVLGFFEANGYTKKKGGLHLVICDQDPELHDHFANWATTIDGTPTLEDREEGSSVWNLFSRALKPWFEKNGLAKVEGNHGEGAFYAEIPEKVLRSRTSVLCAFLRGLFQADGTVNLINKIGAPIIELTTVSPILAQQVHVALESLGIAAHTKKYEKVKGSLGNRTKYRVRIAGIESSKLFAEKIGFISKRKKERLEIGINAIANQSDRIRSMTHQGLIDDFYIRSKGLPSFIRQDISSRKTDGKFNLNWAQSLIQKVVTEYADSSLAQSQISKLLELGSNLRFVEIVKVERREHPVLTYDISVPARNTYVANSFVTHNTISFMMDCDSTGIEPLFALKSYKTLAGGGMMEIVPDCVEKALTNLGVESLENLSDAQQKIFETANDIPWQAHIDMMAATQPHLNGAISKTINMPAEATVDEVEQAYIYGYTSRLKALAIYRDGSKGMQPLSTKKEEPKAEPNLVERPLRAKMDETRDSKTHKFDIQGFVGYLTVGLYPDGRPGELFIRTSKGGSTMDGVMDSFAKAISFALQYGVPLETLIDKFKDTRFDPSGWTVNKEVPVCSSIVDYIFKWLEKTFVESDVEEMFEETDTSSTPPPQLNGKFEGPPCQYCGAITQKLGTCWFCSSCGQTSGCS